MKLIDQIKKDNISATTSQILRKQTLNNNMQMKCKIIGIMILEPNNPQMFISLKNQKSAMINKKKTRPGGLRLPPQHFK